MRRLSTISIKLTQLLVFTCFTDHFGPLGPPVLKTIITL